MSSQPLDALLSLADVAGDAPRGDPEEEGLAALRELGRELTHGLFQCLRIFGIHRSENAAVDEPLRRLQRTLVELFGRASTVHFINVEGQVYLNDLHVRIEVSGFDNVAWLIAQLHRHGIGGITFHRALASSELKELVRLLTGRGAEEPLPGLRAALEQAGIEGVSFDAPYFFRGADHVGGSEERGAQAHAALSYAKGVLAVKDYLLAVESAEAANPLRIRKIVHDLVDVAENEPGDFLKLHTIHGVEDAYYSHCVNVAALAVAMGQELGLTRVELADLGSAAMFHDLGYSALEREERERGQPFSPLDRRRLHPIAGFRALLRQGEFGPGLLRRLLVTLEHHMTFARPGGYPQVGTRALSVFTRIVQVADHYDALVGASDEEGLLPVHALERIVAEAGRSFDPVMVKALVQVLGATPYGSLVRLDDGSLGVVTSGGRDRRRFTRPIVTLVRDRFGQDLERKPLDLGAPEGAERSILEVLDPRDARITPHALLFDRLSGSMPAVPASGPEDLAALAPAAPPVPDFEDEEFSLEIEGEDSGEELGDPVREAAKNRARQLAEAFERGGEQAVIELLATGVED